MAPNILVTADFSPVGLEQLRELGEVSVDGWGVTGAIASEAETARMFARADIVAIGYEPVTEAVFAATDLKYLASIRGGPGANIDLTAAAKRGIPVTGTVGREAKPVADHAFGLMLSVLRHITLTDRLLRTGGLAGDPDDDSGETGWGMGPRDPWNRFKGFELTGKTIGLVGLGTVGREMVKRARGFDMRVLAFDPYITDPGDVQMCGLDALLAEADVVSIHARVTEESAGMIGEREFGLMKPDAVLINTARAGLVSRPALVDALTSGRICWNQRTPAAVSSTRRRRRSAGSVTRAVSPFRSSSSSCRETPAGCWAEASASSRCVSGPSSAIRLTRLQATIDSPRAARARAAAIHRRRRVCPTSRTRSPEPRSILRISSRSYRSPPGDVQFGSTAGGISGGRWPLRQANGGGPRYSAPPLFHPHDSAGVGTGE